MKNLLTLKNFPPRNLDCAIGLRAITLSGAQAPTEFPLLMPGTWNGYLREGKQRSFTITMEDIQAAVNYHMRRKQRNPKRDLVLDYEHQTLAGGEAPAAAWFDIAVRDGVLWAVNVRWTERAKTMVEAGEYRYVSPVFQFGVLDKVTGEKIRMGVFNGALTNEPFLDELPPLVAKDTDVQLYLFNSSHTTKEYTMNEILQFLLRFFELPEDASESTILDRLKETLDGVAAKDLVTLKAARTNYAMVAKALGQPENALPERLTALIAARSDTSQYVSRADYIALKSRLNEREADELLAKYPRKITPAMREHFRALALRAIEAGDTKQFTDVVESMVDVVPLGAPADLDKNDRNSSGNVTETDLLIAKNLGVDPEKLKATAKSLN